MLAQCTGKFQSIHFLSFSSETITKQQEAKLQFHQSYGGIKRTQKFHYFHPTPIKIKGISRPVATGAFRSSVLPNCVVSRKICCKHIIKQKSCPLKNVFYPTKLLNLTTGLEISLISTYSLVVQISTNYQLKSICLKGNYIAAVYDKTWYTGIVQDADQDK